MPYQDLTIVITSFNSQEKIFDCLKGINPNIRIIIIENSNDNELKEKVEKLYNNIEVILSKENLGYGKANNLGLSQVRTKYALIINPDAQVEDSTIDNFFKSAKKNPDLAIISPFIQEQKNLQNIDEKKINKLIEVVNVKGFAMFLNLKEFKEVGFFDENFFIYFEEIDLCRRLRENNKKLYLDPDIRVYHLGGSSHDVKINYEMELSRNWHWMWSTFYYHRKYNGYFLAFLMIFPKLFSSLFKIIFYTLTLNRAKKRIYFQRFSGLINSILLKPSWYRPKILNV